MPITRRQVCVTASRGVLGMVLGSTGFANAPETLIVRYFDYGFSGPLRLYFNDLVTSILQITTSQFGPFQTVIHDERLSPVRTMLEVAKGEILHLAFASSWFRNTMPKDSYVEFENAFLFNLIGLRSFIIRPETRPVLAKVTRSSQVYKLPAGQGEGWPDSKILKHNGFTVVEGYDMDSLFPMLVKKRFDLFPLSILEADRTVNDYKARYPDILIQPGLNLYYPFPFSLFISARRPRIVERFRYGVDLALANGTIKTLFSKHFGEVEERLSKGGNRLILAENNLMSPAENRANVTRFLDTYGTHFDIIN